MRSMAPQEYSLNESFDECQRNGAMVAFRSFEEFLNEYETVLELFDQDRSQNGSRYNVNAGTPGSWDESKLLYNRSALQKEPTNILYIALKVGDNELEITDKLNQFCRGRTHQLSEAMIRRLTFIILSPRASPRYFTFRSRKEYEEDTIYRHLEPALAFQLELNRLKNYDLQSVPTSNHKMHIYLGTAKVAKGRPVSDHRFFIRSIIRHSDLITGAASFEYMKNEGERMQSPAHPGPPAAASLPHSSCTRRRPRR